MDGLVVAVGLLLVCRGWDRDLGFRFSDSDSVSAVVLFYPLCVAVNKDAGVQKETTE